MDSDRQDFARRQAEMTSQWFENVKRTHGDVDQYIASRHEAYLDRWREAGRFIGEGARVLDVGGGNLFPALVGYFKEKRLAYHYLDIDPAAVEGSRRLLAQSGFDPSNANEGFNDNFAYSDNSFDCIFSSHCIEHSIDLPRTFRELNRLVSNGGNLLMAVPFGWEENPEHPYFFDPEQWIALVEDAGFQIRVAQVGREYPETGYDFFIAARKVGAASHQPRIDANAFKKENYRFVDFRHPSIAYRGDNTVADHGAAQHLRGDDWSIAIRLPEPAQEVLPVMLRHDWSGTAMITNEAGQSVAVDLFGWFPYVAAPRLVSPGRKFSRLEIKCTGRAAASRSTEGVFYGYMWR
jgi:SAM-dependent methyltransferase